jgi:hypothetical protein
MSRFVSPEVDKDVRHKVFAGEIVFGDILSKRSPRHVGAVPHLSPHVA